MVSAWVVVISIQVVLIVSKGVITESTKYSLDLLLSDYPEDQRKAVKNKILEDYMSSLGNNRSALDGLGQ